MQYQAKKKFGQNFLKDRSYISRIIQSIPNIYTNEQIIEVGVGLGDLSDELLKRYPIKAYEIDSDLCSLLKQKYLDALRTKRLELIEQDVLKLAHTDGWLHQDSYILISNLPYYAATHIVLRALKDTFCKGFVVMTQKEVAQKFCAKSGDSTFCALSIIAQMLGEVSYLFDVPNTAFEPIPKVTSAVFSIKKNSTILQEGFEDFLKIAFCSPRKKLFKNLAVCHDKQTLSNIFTQLDISTETRAHQLNIKDYHQIFKKLIKENNDGK